MIVVESSYSPWNNVYWTETDWGQTHVALVSQFQERRTSAGELHNCLKDGNGKFKTNGKVKPWHLLCFQWYIFKWFIDIPIKRLPFPTKSYVWADQSMASANTCQSLRDQDQSAVYPYFRHKASHTVCNRGRLTNSKSHSGKACCMINRP